MNIVFFNYGMFGNNSSYHIDGFAEGLAARGHRVGIIAGGPPDGDNSVVIRGSTDQFAAGALPEALASVLKDRTTIIHAWTPREGVRKIVEPFAESGMRYVVHLEDSERLVTASHLNVPISSLDRPDFDLVHDLPGHVSHPTRSRKFLENASGVTVIFEALYDHVPAGRPTFLLEPGVDCDMFKPQLSPERRAELRIPFVRDEKSILLIYHGSIHPAIQRDIFSLYTAVKTLRRRGVDLNLLRTAESEHVNRSSSDFRQACGVKHLGYVKRAEIPVLLDLADMYVQPGWVTPFNAHRFPSKIPEFLAMGRPIILPPTNIGSRLADRSEALILNEGGYSEISHAILCLIENPILAKEIGEGGQAFARRHLNWGQKVLELEKFYSGL